MKRNLFENGAIPEKAGLKDVVLVMDKASSEARTTSVTCNDIRTVSALFTVAPA